MRTCLYSASYLDGQDALGNDRLERTLRYLKYYDNISQDLGVQAIELLDNGSPPEKLKVLDHHGIQVPFYLNMAPHLHRLDQPNGYIYCWRALYFMEELISQYGYGKIICIDTDSFILSGKMANYIKELNSGWTTFWSKKYSFPTAECHILCKDALSVLQKYTEVPYEKRVGELMETSIPFTHIERSFNCDRYGETDDPQRPEMDAYFQAKVSRPLVFRR